MIELTAQAVPLMGVSAISKICWGYEIYADQTLYIRQLYVPSVHGYKGFSVAGDALKAANLVIAKLKKGENPALDSSELSDAGIQVLALAGPPVLR